MKLDFSENIYDIIWNVNLVTNISYVTEYEFDNDALVIKSGEIVIADERFIQGEEWAIYFFTVTLKRFIKLFSLIVDCWHRKIYWMI